MRLLSSTPLSRRRFWRRRRLPVPWLVALVVGALLVGVAVTTTSLPGGDSPRIQAQLGAEADTDATDTTDVTDAADATDAADGDAPEAPVGSGVIQDTDIGSGVGQVHFDDGWQRCTTTCRLVPDGSYRWAGSKGGTATLRFSGRGVVLWGVVEPWSRIATVTIDGGPPQDVDFYAPEQKLARVFTSEALEPGEHTLVLTISDRRNPASSRSGDAITFDRAEIMSPPGAPIALAPQTDAPPSPIATRTPAPAAPTVPPAPAAPAAPVAAGDRKTDTSGKLSGLPWMSGVHPANELQPYLDFGEWRGRQIDLAHVFTERRKSWTDIVEPSWPVDDFASFPGKLVISQPMYPKNGGWNNQDCAKGAYDEHWKKFGAFLVNRNRADSIVRIGWEFNGTFTYWRVDADPTAWKECFRKVAAAIRSTDPQVVIDWTINAHGSPVPKGGDPFTAYPGDDVVDIVGIDTYDHTAPSKDQAGWDAQCNAVDGLCSVLKFARAHSKQASVGEWGVVNCGAPNNNRGGDNPFYIQKMFETFQANEDILAYEAYYHDPVDGNVCSTIQNGGQNPKASAKYRDLYAK